MVNESRWTWATAAGLLPMCPWAWTLATLCKHARAAAMLPVPKRAYDGAKKFSQRGNRLGKSRPGRRFTASNRY
jgi:hypothetical protein